ncbi:MAG TPA: hypothetical protein PK894_03270 [Defluviitoga sp.]|nr:hypothetical protein [Defluviitoga sp.]HOP24407.1 hypothetical protein [Defluviitoga sp.]HPZ28603.1 hypothetical protein [Defluviitoga sp.]HQD62606.1 hypothetical protein [Defluviitoga sp.]
MKIILTFIIMVPIIIFSILSYHYVGQIVRYRNIKNVEIKEALDLINEVEEIYALPLEEFLQRCEIKDTIITTEATIYIFEHDGYDFLYISK